MKLAGAVQRFLSVSYAKQSKAAAFLFPSNQQARLFSARLLNGSGGVEDIGILKTLNSSKWDVGTITTGGTVFASVKAALTAGTATSLFTTTTNDGFIVQASELFSLVGFTISQAETGSPVYSYQYWNGAAWAALPAISLLTSYATGDKLLVFKAPADWTPGGDVALTNAAWYQIRARATTAPTQAVQANAAAWIGQMIAFQPSVADKTAFSWAVGVPNMPLLLEVGENLLPYFGTASSGNMVEAQYITQLG